MIIKNRNEFNVVNVEELKDYKLEKRACITISGDDVTVDQAWEIIIRTSDDYLIHKGHCLFRERNDTGNLNLSLLRNELFLEGPFMWCSFDGRIENLGENIGRWNKSIDVYNDIKLIAKCFSFINMRLQLFNENSFYIEDKEKDFKPILEFWIENGKVTIVKPHGYLIPKKKMIEYKKRKPRMNRDKPFDFTIDELKKHWLRVKDKIKNERQL